MAAGDVLNAPHLHIENVINTCPVVLGLDPTFSGATAFQTINRGYP